MNRLLPLASALALAACGSYHDDVDAICNCEARSGASALPPEKRAAAVAAWADGHVHTKKGKDLASSFATMPPADRGRTLRDAAKAEGISPCPFADSADTNAKSPP